MTFLEALRTGQPMRRRMGWLTGPWISQGRLAKDARPRPEFAEPWVRGDTGTQLTLSREDYLADDWEVKTS